MTIRSKLLASAVLCGIIGADPCGTSLAQSQIKTAFRKPAPQGVIEVLGINARGGIVELANGSLMLAQGKSSRISSDGGRSWSEAQPLKTSIEVDGMIRLKSGVLAIHGTSGENRCFATSADEGKTWGNPYPICPTSVFNPMPNSLIQLRSGRLLVVGYWEGLDSWEYQREAGTMVSVHPDLQYLDVSAYGLWRGQKVQIEGHAHAPEMGMTIVYRSDDQGKSWKKHPGALMGWFDFEGVVNGACGLTPCFEPTIAETKDGNVLVIARSTVGRLVQSVSTDGGEHFYSVKPSELPSSESPAFMAHLPGTGDLLLVWNQVSREEIRRGYRRGRLSSAISRDGGHSWEKFKTLELSEGLEDVSRIQPEYPLQMVRARDFVGTLPEAWAYFHYPNIDLVGDKVIVRYNRGSPLQGVAELAIMQLFQGRDVLRVYPVKWFYE